MLPRIAVLLLAASLIPGLSACGFHLRGQQKLPFATLAVPGGSPIVNQIKRGVAATSDTQIVEDAKEAEAVLVILRENREKVILSLSSAGSVREYQLRYLVSYRVTRKQGGEFIPATTLILTRDMSFNSEEVLSKETEETLLYNEMRNDFVQQLMRRMASSKPIVVE